MDEASKGLVIEILTKLLLTKQQTRDLNGNIYEGPSIFESIVWKVRDDFQVSENMKVEIQAHLAEYYAQNKEEILGQIVQALIDRIQNFRSYDLDAFIGKMGIPEAVLKVAQENQELKEAILVAVGKTSKDLEQRVRNGDIKVNLDLKL